MATVEDAIKSWPLLERVGCKRMEELLLLGQGEITPHCAQQNIGERDHLLPSQAAQSGEIEYPPALAFE